MNHHFLWLDIETTGLHPATCHIMEWALILADDAPGGSFAPVATYGSPVTLPEGVSSDTVDPYVRDMHTRNGLWDACAGPDAAPIEEVDAFLAGLCAELGVSPRGGILAGASVHFDLGFCRAHLPKFARYLSHRVLDVSTLWIADSIYHDPEVGPVEHAPRESHRALADIEATLLDGAAHLRAHYFGALPGMPAGGEV